MRLVKALKLLICFVIILPCFWSGQASAMDNYDHDELMQYEGYGKAMYESIVEQTTFLTGQYTDNKEYVKGSINEIKEYANFWGNERQNWEGACGGFELFTMDCMGDTVERAGAYVLTVGDWVKKLFTDYEKEENGELEYDGIFIKGSSDPYLNSPYIVTVKSTVDGRSIAVIKSGTVTMSGRINDKTLSINGSIVASGVTDWSLLTQFREEPTYSKFVTMMMAYNQNVIVTLTTSDGSLPVSRPAVNPNLQKISGYVNEKPNPIMPVPQLKPQLICPNGTKINMSVSGSTFLSNDGSIMQVEKDGTSVVNGQDCLLDWEKPKVDYVNGEAAVTDSKGNWLAIGTSDVVVCLDSAGCELAPVDNSLLDYVKNAYNYGTGVLKTATDGLKSLATGAKDLTALFGTFFGWLPTEIVVLMSSGLGIMVGLRVFRK